MSRIANLDLRDTTDRDEQVIKEVLENKGVVVIRKSSARVYPSAQGIVAFPEKVVAMLLKPSANDTFEFFASVSTTPKFYSFLKSNYVCMETITINEHLDECLYVAKEKIIFNKLKFERQPCLVCGK